MKTTGEEIEAKINEYFIIYMKLEKLALEDMFDESKCIKIKDSQFSEIKNTVSRSNAGFKILHSGSSVLSRNYSVCINKKFATYASRKIKQLAVYKRHMKYVNKKVKLKKQNLSNNYKGVDTQKHCV